MSAFLFIIIKAMDFNLNLDEEVKLTKRDKVRMKKEQKKKKADRRRTLQIDSVV